MRSELKRLWAGQRLDNLYPDFRRMGLVSPRSRIMTLASPEFATANAVRLARATVTVGAWPSANKPVAIPFTISVPIVVAGIGIRNPAGGGANWDVGVYDAAFNRKVSSGLTAGVASAAYQDFDVTDTPILPGRYYLVAMHTATTASQVTFITLPSSTPFCQLMGVFDSATNASPLPDPLTNMVLAATFVRIPPMYLRTRVLF